MQDEKMTDDIDDFVDSLMKVCCKTDKETSSSSSSSELEQLLEQSSSSSSSSSSPLVSIWIPRLIQRLFNETTSKEALTVVTTLVSCNDVKYSLPISESVNHYYYQHNNQDQTTTTSFISNEVLQVWIYQLCCTSQISVHSNLLSGLLLALPQQQQNNNPQTLLHVIMSNLVTIWRNQQQRDNNSIVTIRCATTFLRITKVLGDKAFQCGKEEGAVDLLRQMIGNKNDPLLQLSALDLFPQTFDNLHQSPIPITTREWMASQASMIITNVLDDPIVGGAAMQYLGLVATLEDEHVLQSLFQYIRKVGPTANESERLRIVHVLRNLAQSSPKLLELILQDRDLKNAWWDFSRVGVPKLQAAILTSVAQTVSAPQTTNAPLLLRMYTSIGLDNGAESTTAWMVQKFSRSPMTELKIASFHLWSCLCMVTGGTTILASNPGFMDVVVVHGERESSHDARLARYELLEAFHNHAKGFLAAPIVKKLDEQLQLGPHGIKAQRWDVATGE